MSQCVTKRIKRRKLCAGDLNILITIKTREFVGPKNTVDFSQDFATLATVWAGLETTDGRNMFYLTNVNGDNEITHIFYTRWLSGLDAEKWIEYGGENYDIIKVENYEERNEWAVCYCNVRGTKAVAVNDA